MLSSFRNSRYSLSFALKLINRPVNSQTKSFPTYRAFTSTKMTTTDQEKSLNSPQPLIMQLIVDSNLFQQQPGWSMGPMMAQAGHATCAIIAETYAQPNTQAYLSTSNLPKMRKVVLKTGKGTTLEELSQKLKEAKQKADQNNTENQNQHFPQHHLWIEQPENIPTVLAIAPNNRPSVSVQTSQSDQDHLFKFTIFFYFYSTIQALKKVLNDCSLLRD